MSYDKSTQGAIKEVQHEFIENRLSQFFSSTSISRRDSQNRDQLTMHEILESSNYDHVPDNAEHPMSLCLNDQLRLTKEKADGKSLTMAEATGGITKQALNDLEIPNETTEKKHNHYVQDYCDFIHNEREQHASTDKRTLVNF